jgi:hypothetical protein
MPLIEIHNLVKHYGAIRAVDDLSFSVEPGIITGFLGPNGFHVGSASSMTSSSSARCSAVRSGPLMQPSWSLPVQAAALPFLRGCAPAARRLDAQRQLRPTPCPHPFCLPLP